MARKKEKNGNKGNKQGKGTKTEPHNKKIFHRSSNAGKKGGMGKEDSKYEGERWISDDTTDTQLPPPPKK